jgi:hypothetical protein
MPAVPEWDVLLRGCVLRALEFQGTDGGLQPLVRGRRGG